MRVFQKLLSILNKSDDLFMLQYGTTSLKTFACFAAHYIRERPNIIS